MRLATLLLICALGCEDTSTEASADVGPATPDTEVSEAEVPDAEAADAEAPDAEPDVTPPYAPVEPAPGGPPFDWCEPDLAPDAECFAQRRAPDSEHVDLARAIGDKILATHSPETITWDWGEAVMMVGLVQLYRVTGDARYRDFYRAWMDHHLEQGYEIWSSDTCAPVAIAIALIADGLDEPRYRAVVEDALDYLKHRALRTPEGGLNHLGTNEVAGVSMWADSLFMFGNVLSSWGELEGDRRPLDLYATQFDIFTEALQEEAGFYKHAIHTHFPQDDEVYWGRANGWIAAAAANHLRTRRVLFGETLPLMQGATERLLRAALENFDEEAGLWWTVVNRPGETYRETSASALFAYGLARAYRTGWMGEEVLPVVRRAIEGVSGRILGGAEGWPLVTGVSGPTNVGRFDYYAGVPLEDDLSYGLGAVLLALTEASGLPGMNPTEALAEQPIEASEGYLARKAEYLERCLAASGPESGGLGGLVCRVGSGLSDLDDGALAGGLAKMEAREDTADFTAARMLRLLYLDDETGALGEARRASVEQTLLAFKYWIDEPGQDQMAYWTENHQILFHSAELLAGQRWREQPFGNDGKTGAEHMAHATPRILRWLDLRGRYGFSEWHSNIYFNEDIPALLNLVDFAEDPVIQTGAAMVLDLIALDLLHNTFRGRFVTTRGRTYPSTFEDGLRDSTTDAAWIMLGLGEPGGRTNFSGSFLATSEHMTAAPLEALAEAVRERHEHRQRDGFDVAHGPAVGVSYEGLDDVVIWAGMAALVAPQVILGASLVLEEYELWDGFLLGDLPPELTDLLRNVAGTLAIVGLATALEIFSRGLALESVDTYVYRTPHYQLAGAQDYKPGMWGAQTLMWMATLDDEAFVLTSFPGGPQIPGAEGIQERASDPWTGGWNPRATFHRNVGVIQYRRNPTGPGFEDYAAGDRTHAFIPRAGFDAIRTEGHWTFGRKGEAWIALWSHIEPQWVDEGPELLAEGEQNVWIVELGSVEEQPDFESFVEAILAAPVEVGETVRYESPSQGSIEVGWTGPLQVEGAPVPLGPHLRWDNAFHQQRHGARQTRITYGGQTLELDFTHLTRRLLR